MRPTRRQLLKMLPAGLVPGLLRPGLARAASASDRKFLFVLCYGGWDTTMAWTPMGDNPLVDTEQDAVASVIGGLPLVDHPDRPNLRAFFESYGDKTCVINGIEARSVAHERCLRLILTAGVESGRDDWATILAAHSPTVLPMPHLVLYGPAYANRFGGGVVRVGSNGQLTQLLHGDALLDSELAVPIPSESAESAVDALLRTRLERFGTGSGVQGGELAVNYATALDDRDLLRALAGDLSLEATDLGCSRDLASDCAAIFDAFELGLSRCAMVQYDGWCRVGWDSHQDLQIQSTHYDQLFRDLGAAMLDLEARGSLADDVTIVLLSEMGRHPQLNSWGGKDHWTTTSAVILGAGVQGGQVIGELDDVAQGKPVDLETGELSDSGEQLTPGHLGATLMALGDVDPGEFVDEGPLLSVLA